MDSLKSTETQQLNDYYGPLLNQHVRTILESGLLLDEDYEVLLKASNFKIYPLKSAKLPLGLIVSALATIGSVFVAKRYDLSLVVLPPSAVTIGLLCLELKSMAKRRRNKEITNYLVQHLIKVQKLNATIIRYTKLRVELSSTKEAEILLYNDNFKVFTNFLLGKYREYFKTFLQELELLASLTNELSNDFQGLQQLDIDLFLATDYSSFNDYFCVTCKVQDVYIFLSSKFLNYLALTLCKNLTAINVPELEFLFDKTLPRLNDILDKLYGNVLEEFNNLRYSSTKKVEIDTKNKRYLTRHVSGKLHQTLISAVNNLSIIMEKSQTVLYKVERAENENDVKQLERALSDLRDHAFATYESLNVLCKLYGIFSDANRSKGEGKSITAPKTNIDSQREVQTLSYDDAADPLEENYELFIPKIDVVSKTQEIQDSYVDQSGVYLNLMLKELRQSLKQHERFIAARDKRGLKDEDEERDNDKESRNEKETKMPPKFDLSACNSKNEITDLVSNVPPVPPPRPSKMPPPPPPPPPSFDLSNLEAVSGQKGSLFENIRMLSSQIQGKEDVFGSLSDSD